MTPGRMATLQLVVLVTHFVDWVHPQKVIMYEEGIVEKKARSVVRPLQTCEKLVLVACL